MYSALLLFLSTAGLVAGFPNGPPVAAHPEICGSMFPSGHHNATARTTTPPFKFTFTPACYKNGASVEVKLSAHDTYYEGLFVQARDSSNTGSHASHGQFTTTDDTLDTYDCFKSGRKNALGHKSKDHYTEKSFMWKPNANLKKNIKFVATVVHETDEFWVQVKSETLKYDAECGDVSSHTVANVFLLATALLWSFL